MVTSDKAGEVKRRPLGALKKMCQEDNIVTILGGKLEKYQTLVRNAVENNKHKEDKLKEEYDINKALFSITLKEIQEQRGETTEIAR